MEILRVILTPEELESSPKLQRLLRADGRDAAETREVETTTGSAESEFPDEVETLMGRAPGSGQDRIRRLVTEALGMGDVEAVPGRKRNTGKMTGYIRLVRTGIPYGTFAYVFPRRQVMNVRLPREAASEYRTAWARGEGESQRPFQVAVRLSSDAGVDEGIRLAKEAFERVVDE
jgi:hypothetical protein